MIPSLWTATLEIALTIGVSSKVILASKVTSNIRRSADSSSTVPSRINRVYWGWIVIVLVLLAFNFIPHRSHHILTPFRSRFRDSVTATPLLGMALQLPKWSGQHNSRNCFTLWRKAARCTAGTNADPKHFPDSNENAAENSKKDKVFYGQEPPRGESTATDCGVNYQLLTVIYLSSPMGNS